MWWMLIVPVIVVVSLYIFFPDRMAWFEYAIPVVVTLISIALVSVVCDYLMSYDEEFHGGWVVQAVWDEHWTETYTETESYTDSEGHSHTMLVTKTRYHPDVYEVIDSNGYIVSVNELKFNQLAGIFNNRKTENPWRSGQSSWLDGRRFTTSWSGDNETFIPCFTSHGYENRIVKSRSVFNFRDVSNADKKKFGIYEYPKIYDFYSQASMLGYSDQVAQKSLSVANARLGAIEQLRIFVLVFHNKPIAAGFTQQQYWKNGNKNEVVVCVGMKDSKIDWVFSFAWDNERLLADLNGELAFLPDIRRVVSRTIQLAEKDFKRKNFKEFEYIRLQPPTWAVLLSLCCIVAINAITVYIVVSNDTKC